MSNVQNFTQDMGTGTPMKLICAPTEATDIREQAAFLCTHEYISFLPVVIYTQNG